jgi:predicted ATPase/DNA-binding NarL/FixJ family response regulator
VLTSLISQPIRQEAFKGRVDSFVGRYDEVETVSELLMSAQLVTLTGPVGVGKSRLAREVAHHLQDHFEGRCRVIDLGAVTTPRALRLLLAQPKTDRHRISITPSLLVADNCDYLRLPIAVILHDALNADPFLRVLATCRQPLTVRREVIWFVRPLEVPAAAPGFGGATQLFLGRLRTGSPQRVLSTSEANLVPELCRQLDGSPLAIELAACQTANIPLRRVIAMIDNSAFLDLPIPMGLSRDPTLRASWRLSWLLLAPHEQVALSAIAIFPGSFDSLAAEAVLRNVGKPGTTSDLLNALIRCSFVQVDSTNERFTIGNLTRRFALDLLPESEHQQLRATHAGYFAEIACEAGWFLEGHDELLWTSRFRDDEHNLKCAREWSNIHDRRRGLQIGIALAQYLAIRGRFVEGRRLLETSLERMPSDPTLMTVSNCLLGHLAMLQHDHKAALTFFRTGVKDAQSLSCKQLSARCSLGLATVHQFEGDLDSAYRLAVRVAEDSKQADDIGALAAATNRIGYVKYLRREYSSAEKVFTKALALARAAGSLRRAAIVITNIGELAVSQGNYDLARKMLDEASLAWKGLGDDYAFASNLEAIAVLDLKTGQLSRCAEHLFEVGAILVRMDSPVATDVIEIGVMLATAEKRHERAITLAAAGAVYRGNRGLQSFAEDPVLYYGCLRMSRQAIGPYRAAQAEAAGRLLGFTSAVDLACVNRQADSPHITSAAALSRREFEVVSILARGSSNRDIAAALGISPSTVEVHVENIRRKLGFTSRTEIAVWFVTELDRSRGTGVYSRSS